MEDLPDARRHRQDDDAGDGQVLCGDRQGQGRRSDGLVQRRARGGVGDLRRSLPLVLHVQLPFGDDPEAGRSALGARTTSHPRVLLVGHFRYLLELHPGREGLQAILPDPDLLPTGRQERHPRIRREGSHVPRPRDEDPRQRDAGHPLQHPLEALRGGPLPQEEVKKKRRRRATRREATKRIHAIAAAGEKREGKTTEECVCVCAHDETWELRRRASAQHTTHIARRKRETHDKTEHERDRWNCYRT
mmetsp:Transcript_2143/g.5684  ORF Transcript_2143/g.5684 Transcript_2143/m.5684 type:complete len:247 (+) Transcript_2143:494-1234(+)